MKVKLLVLIFAVSFFTMSCFDDNDASTKEGSAREISGTITYIGSGYDLSGLDGTLAVDDDAEPIDDTPIKSWTLTWGTGNTLSYTVDLSDLADGDYYVFFTIENADRTFFVYGYYNNDAGDAYYTKVIVTVQDGAVIDIEIDIT